MKSQRAEIRIVVRDGERQGLYWQANCEDKDLYYGPPHTPLGAMLRGSYHESGASHIHLPDGKKVGRIYLPPPDSLKEPVRLTEQGTPWKDVKWEYKVKDDNEMRKTLVIDFTSMGKDWLPTVEFWAVPNDEVKIVDEIVSKRKGYGDRLLGKVLIQTTTPWLLVLVWLPSQDVRMAFEKSFQGR